MYPGRFFRITPSYVTPKVNSGNCCTTELLQSGPTNSIKALKDVTVSV